MKALSEKNISIPVYAIGGILPEDMNDLMQTGIYGAAVSGAITNSSNKKNTVEQFKLFSNAKINHSEQRI
jgi:thiamine-phosphate pyrophosphorylase